MKIETIKESVFINNFTCECGNQSHLDGFFPCDNKGNIIEPIKGKWKDLYKCQRCDKIYKVI